MFHVGVKKEAIGVDFVRCDCPSIHTLHAFADDKKFGLPRLKTGPTTTKQTTRTNGYTDNEDLGHMYIQQHYR